MFVALLVLGACAGALLGLIVLSFVLRPPVVMQIVSSRPARERRAHEHPDLSKRASRIPAVPPPLAPATATPTVPDAGFMKQRQLGTPVQPIAPLPPSPSAPNSPSAPRAKPVTALTADGVTEAIARIANDAELRQLIENGNLLQAVRRYKEQHGVGVAEAKQALEAFRSQSERNAKVVEAVEHVVDVTATDPQIVQAIRSGKVIEAIKLYRAKTGVSLQDAKAAIDEWRRHMGR